MIFHTVNPKMTNFPSEIYNILRQIVIIHNPSSLLYV